jgi:predicted Zn-dependent peptidase
MFEKIIMQNGLTIVLTRISQIKSLSIGIWVKAGLAYEASYPNGISHLIEHMMFKGTKTRSAKAIAKQIEDIGGELNAFTSKEYTCYFTKSLDEYALKCIQILSDMYFESVFDETELEKEKNVVKQEISMYEDTPDELVHDLVFQNMWSNSIYGKPVSGTKDSVDSISRHNIISYMNDIYTAQNTVISVAGSFDKETILEYINKYFVFKAQSNYESESTLVEYTPKTLYKEKSTDQNHLCIGYKSFDVFDERNMPLSCFNSIFGAGMSSSLFQRIREELGLVYSVFAYNSVFSKSGAYIIYAGYDKSNTGLLLKELDGIIKTMFDEKISEDELVIQKNRLKSSYMLALESSTAWMNYTGSSQTVKGFIYTPDEISQRIDGITLDLMYEAAKDVFESRRTIVLIGKHDGDL